MSTQLTLKDFETIYEETYDRTLKFIVCKCSNIDDVNDLIQDTYTKLYSMLKRKKKLELDNIGLLKFDADANTITIAERYNFVKDATVPKEYKLVESYILYTRENKDKNYNILHDYVFNYIKDDNHSVRILISEIGEPIRDYYAEGEKVSKIGNTEIIIYQYEYLYIATFKDKQINFDIETVGLSETELTDLLVSIIK